MKITNDKRIVRIIFRTYEFADDLCGFYLKKLPEIESREKVRYSELRDKRAQLRNKLQKGKNSWRAVFLGHYL
jgi:hypothetical protein